MFHAHYRHLVGLAWGEAAPSGEISGPPAGHSWLRAAAVSALRSGTVVSTPPQRTQSKELSFGIARMMRMRADRPGPNQGTRVSACGTSRRRTARGSGGRVRAADAPLRPPREPTFRTTFFAVPNSAALRPVHLSDYRSRTRDFTSVVINPHAILIRLSVSSISVSSHCSMSS